MSYITIVDKVWDALLEWNLRSDKDSSGTLERDLVAAIAPQILDFILSSHNRDLIPKGRLMNLQSIVISSLSAVGDANSLSALKRALEYWREQGEEFAEFDVCFGLCAFDSVRAEALRSMMLLNVDLARQHKRDFLIKAALEGEPSLILDESELRILAALIVSDQWLPRSKAARLELAKLGRSILESA